MLGGTSLRRSAAAAAMVRQRAGLPVRSQRSLSSFATGTAKLPLRAGSISPLNSSRRPAIRSLPGLASARFNSTAAGAGNASTVGAASTTPADVAGTPAAADITDIADIDISQIPEKVGYLKELGLDYGWGPSALIQFLLENIHIYAGIPWWASVVAAAAVIRVALFYPTLEASETTAKIHQAKPILDPIRARLLELTKKQDNLGVVHEKQKMTQVNEEYGIKPWKAFMPMLQIPLGFGCFRVMRGMSALPVPALEHENILWLTDLSLKDPTFVLPIATGAMMYFTLKRGGETGASPIAGTPMGKSMIYALPIVSAVATSFWPSLLQLYFFASAALGTVQNLMISSPKFRKIFGIAPLPIHTPTSGGAGQDTSAQGRLRMIAAQAAAEKAASEGVAPKKNVSFIDRAVDNLKTNTQEFRKEAQSQMDKLAGTTGEKSKKPKRSKKDLSSAEAYEAMRREEQEWLRNERNEQRKLEYKAKREGAAAEPKSGSRSRGR